MGKHILHLADTRVDYITYEVLYRAKSCGFTDVQISPVQEDRGALEWWDRYQPVSFDINNIITDMKSLTQLGNRCRMVGIGLIVDIVTHHTTTELIKSKLVELLYSETKSVGNYDSRYESTHYRIGGLPTLDMWSSDVHAAVNNMILELIDCGVTGLRWDACKHIELPEEGCPFFTETMCKFDQLFQYGEVIFTPRELLEKYQKIMVVGTEDSKGTDDTKCVLWAESHDSFREGWSNDLSAQQVVDNYYRLLRDHPNANTLFYQRPFCNIWRDIKH